MARSRDVVIRASEWARVLSRFGTAERPRTYGEEPLWLGGAGQSYDLCLPAAPSFLVISPKRDAVRWWWNQIGLPRDLGSACASFPADPGALPILQPLYRQSAATAFVGDLDPLAIVQYVETRRSLHDPKGPPFLYGGINDVWLEAIRRSLKRPVRFERIRIALSRSEKALLAQIDRAFDLERLVGPHSAEMLRGGYKIELEGATNPRIYSPGHIRWIVRYLRTVLRGAAAARRRPERAT
jgi:hypothetical protein